MSSSAVFDVTSTCAVDWATKQARYFWEVPTSLDDHLSEGLHLSLRQVKRYRGCETPLPLHHGFQTATITGDARLLNTYARVARKLVIDRPSAQTRGKENMEVFLELKKWMGRLDELEYRLLKHGRLVPTEQQEYITLCEQIALKALTLRKTVEEME